MEHQSKVHVLLVDDDKSYSETFGTNFRAGHEVSLVYDGAEAIDAIKGAGTTLS